MIRVKASIETDEVISTNLYEPPTHVMQPLESAYNLSPAEALAAFHAEHADQWDKLHFLECSDMPAGPEPERTLMNWERDPHAEVEDGYLTNLASMYTDAKRRLAWRRQYCVARSIVVICPKCGAEIRTRSGRFGVFHVCACGTKLKEGTGKYAEAAKRVHFCGHPLEARVGNLGNPYLGCNRCAPGGDYERKPIGALLDADVHYE